jgi:hypothetical protein
MDALVYVDVVEGERWNSTIEAEVIESFANAPLTNPDGSTGVRLRIIQRTIPRSVVPPKVVATRQFFQTLYSAGNFTSSGLRGSASVPQLAKYACICPDYFENPSYGGVAIGVKANSMMLTLNEQVWRQEFTNELAQFGLRILPESISYIDDRVNSVSFMHELGHLYGLDHHGATGFPDDDENYKSIMSYAYNGAGIPSGAFPTVDFSRTDIVNMDWRLGPDLGALSLVLGQHGEDTTFYSLVNDFREPLLPAPQEATVSQLVRANPGVRQLVDYANSLNCNDEPSGPPIVVALPPQTLSEKLTTISHPSSTPISVSVPAGPYSVVQGSKDDAHPLQEDQPNERWFAVFYAADRSVVGTTATTEDLPPSSVTAEWVSGTIVLTGNATSVVYRHAPGGDGPDSIYPNLLQLTPGGQYPPRPPCIRRIEPVTPPTFTPSPPSPLSVNAPEVPVRGPALPKTETPGAGVVTTPIVVITSPPATADVVAPIPETTSAGPAVPETKPLVEVQGVQVENAAIAGFAPIEETAVAFTGAQSTAMVAAALLLVVIGTFALLASRKQKLSKK